jgi:mono/diheme cytochrome c family protein
MRVALAVSSFVVLTVHGAVFYDQFFHEWERYQSAYFDQARAMAKTDAERAGLEGRSPRIEQLIVTTFGENRVDRCTSCHIASDDPRFGEHAQPLRTHPYSEALGDTRNGEGWERRHKFADFGCTVCHDGQGRGLDAFDAHGEDHFWPDPMLGYVAQAGWRKDLAPHLAGPEYMQANCAQCHTEENFQYTPFVARGRQLFFEQNCYGCHRIEGLSNGTLGPDLSDVGKKFKLDYIWESIVDPRANSATSFMPKFELAGDDVKALTIFLKSRRGINYAETSLDRYRLQLAKAKVQEVDAGPALDTAPAAAGERFVRERACAACHKVGDRDGRIAPDLSFTGLVRDEEWLMAHFRDPRSQVADSIMPAFGFKDDEYRAMTAYLRGLVAPPALGTPEEIYRDNCARCHGEAGDGKGLIALYLDPAPRDLTKAAFMNSKSEERFLASIKEGVPGTSMAPWGRVLDDDQARGVLAYVFQSFVREPRKPIKERAVPDQNPVAASGESIARGERIYIQRCTGCHGLKADGKGPNSLDIVPRPRNLRSALFVNGTNDKRLFESILYGVQGTAMPPWIDYGLSQNDVGDIVNYLRSLSGGGR